jgi:cation diffusion facilitator family transporter
MKNEKRDVAFFSVLAAIFLTGFKLVVGLMTGSLGILSEALHSALDLVAAVITFFAIKVSDKPADKEHHFGHGKVENFSAFLETILLLITCVWIIYEALHRIVTGNTHIEVSIWSYIVVVSSILIDISRSRALMRVAKKYNSQALEADALHFSTDIWSSAVVLLGLICVSIGKWTGNNAFYYADSIAALVVAIIVIFVSYRLGRKAINALLDGTSAETHDQVVAILSSNKKILKFHDLRIRTSGAETFIDVNIHVNPLLDIKTAHAISESIEEEIKNKVYRSSIIIHIEPDE